jgi:uncharacterized protein (DUF885 family)
MYLNAAVEELQRLNANIEKLIDAQTAPAAQEDVVTLKEPAKPKATTRDAKQAAQSVEPDPKQG